MYVITQWLKFGLEVFSEADSDINVDVTLERESDIRMSEPLSEALYAARPLVGTIPEYSGNSRDVLPEQFLRKFDLFARINGWNEERKLLVVPMQLTEAALSWYESLLDKPESWNKFSEALIKRFTNHGSDAVNFQLFGSRKQRQGESFEKYVDDMKKIAKSIRDKSLVPEGVKVITVLNNLQPKLKFNIMTGGRIPGTLDELESQVRIVEAALNVLNGSYAVNRERRKRYASEYGNENTESTNVGLNGDGRFHRDFSSITCFKCHEIGHYSSNCTKSNAVNNVVVKEEKNVNRVGVVKSYSGVNVDLKNENEVSDFVAVAFIGDIRTEVTLDSGAAEHCMSCKLYRRMDGDVYPLVPTNAVMNHASGEPLDVIGTRKKNVVFTVKKCQKMSKNVKNCSFTVNKAAATVSLSIHC